MGDSAAAPQNQPHEFVASRSHGEWCKVCGRWKYRPIHGFQPDGDKTVSFRAQPTRRMSYPTS